MHTKLLLASLLFLTLTLFGNQGLIRLIELKGRAASLEAENQSLVGENAELASEIQRLSEPEYLERLIREEQGYTREGEILLELPKSP